LGGEMQRIKFFNVANSLAIHHNRNDECTKGQLIRVLTLENDYRASFAKSIGQKTPYFSCFKPRAIFLSEHLFLLFFIHTGTFVNKYGDNQLNNQH
jgi:hypothetical protein